MIDFKTINAVIFDFDDTLVLTGEQGASLLCQAAKEFNLPIPHESTVRELFGRPFIVIIEMLWPMHDAQELHEKFVEYYKVRQVAHEVAGTIDVLKLLQQQGKKLYILTSRGKRSLEFHLTKTKLSSIKWDGIYAYEDVEHHKPDERVFDVFKERYKPNEIAYIGDSVHDCIAALKAGLHFVGVLTGHTTLETFRHYGAEHVVSSVAGLIDVL